MKNNREEYEIISDIINFGYSIDDVIGDFFPDNIIISAQAYDQPGWITWLWERILEPKNIKGIRTPDGAIVFDDKPTRFEEED